MNILIIGNGFDLAHKLPTTYSNFLDFTEEILRIKNFNGTVADFESGVRHNGFLKLDEDVRKYIHDKIIDNSNPYSLVNDIYTRNKDCYLEEFIELAENNIWIKWFKKAKIKKGWIDFEDEISTIVQKVEKILDDKNVIDNDEYKINITNISVEDFEFIKLFLKYSDNIFLSEEIKNIKKKMINDLNGLIRCLEIYLEDCVRKVDKSLLSSDIYNLNIDKVLSFNYTDTYKRFYSIKHKNVDYDYLHGKSNLSKTSSNNIVLGIDEYLSEEEKFTNVNFIEFKKYFQRIHKSTGCVYRKWLEEINHQNNLNHNAYFFGHSLSITDKDVIIDFLTNDNITVTIYYRNEKHYAELITNIVKLIGPDFLTEKVFGTNPKIIFIKQHDMVDIMQSEWQILNDCNALWKLYSLSDMQINEITNRISNKITEEDITYFYSQRSIINLYDALINNVNISNLDSLLTIAEKLYDSESYEVFNFEDWNDIDYQGTKECKIHVKNFINKINRYNYEQHQKIKNDFAVDDLDSLYNQIKTYNFDDEKADEIFDSLIKKFKNDTANLDLVWKCIFTLLRKMNEDSRNNLIQNKSLTSDTHMSIRIKYISEVLAEEDYYKSMAEDETNYDLTYL